MAAAAAIPQVKALEGLLPVYLVGSSLDPRGYSGRGRPRASGRPGQRQSAPGSAADGKGPSRQLAKRPRGRPRKIRPPEESSVVTPLAPASPAPPATAAAGPDLRDVEVMDQTPMLAPAEQLVQTEHRPLPRTGSSTEVAVEGEEEEEGDRASKRRRTLESSSSIPAPPALPGRGMGLLASPSSLLDSLAVTSNTDPQDAAPAPAPVQPLRHAVSDGGGRLSRRTPRPDPLAPWSLLPAAHLTPLEAWPSSAQEEFEEDWAEWLEDLDLLVGEEEGDDAARLPPVYEMARLDLTEQDLLQI